MGFSCSKLVKDIADGSIRSAMEFSNCIPGMSGRAMHLQRACDINELPTDLLLKCLAYVSTQNLVQVRGVCSRWRILADSEMLEKERRAVGNVDTWLIVAATEGHDDKRTFRIRIFSVASRRWMELPIPHELHSLAEGFAMAICDRKLFILGGQTRKIHYLHSNWCFDFRKNKWEKRASMKLERKFHGCGVLGGRIFVGGGMVRAHSESSPCEIYDPMSNRWEEVPDAEVPSTYYEGWVVHDKLYMAATLPDRVYVLQPPQLSLLPRNRVADPLLSLVSHVCTMGGRLYGALCWGVRQRRVSVFSEEERSWKELQCKPASHEDMSIMSEKFEALVCGGCLLLVVTWDNFVLGLEVEPPKKRKSQQHAPAANDTQSREDSSSSRSGSDAGQWEVLSRGCAGADRSRWRQFGCLEF